MLCRLVLIAFVAAPCFAQMPTTIPSGPVPEGFGVNIHFTDPRPGELQMLAAAGFKWVRMDLNWSGIERKKGEYDFAAYDRLTAALDKQGIKALFILDYGNKMYDNGESPSTDEGRAGFSRWAAATATHFKGRGYLWEMWNEPNIQFWKPKPNVDDYAKLALAVGKAMHDAVPGETYIGPATSGIDLKFIETCFKANCLEYWSAVSVHPYRQTHPESAATEYRNLRLLIARYAPKDKKIPIISGEWGYSSAWHNLSEETQGKFLPRELLTNLWQEVPLSIWYDWHEDGADPREGEHHFGSVRFPYRKDEKEVYEPKPAYLAMKTLAEQLKGYRFNKRLVLEKSTDFALLFEKGGQVKIVAWTTENQPHNATLPASKGTFDGVSTLGANLEPIAAGANGLSVMLTDAPVFLTPRAANDLLRVAAAWHRLPLDVCVKWPERAHVDKGFDNPLDRELKATISDGAAAVTFPSRGSSTSTGLGMFVPVTRSPTPTLLRESWTFEGLGTLTQETQISAMNPIRAALLSATKDSLPVEIEDPSGEGLAGTVSLIGIEGVEVDQTSQPFALKPGETRVTVRFAIKPEGSDYSVGLQITDPKAQVLLEVPQSNFFGMGDFSLGAVDGKTDAYKLSADGSAKVASEQSLTVATPPESSPEPGMGVLKMAYKCEPGWKFWEVKPARAELKTIKGEPKALGLWIYGDGAGSLPRLRFIDSTGQTFQPAGESITWKGWKYVTFPMDAAHSAGSHWGGDNDGVIHYPIHWETIFLLDRDAKRPAEGVVYIAGPTLIR